MAERKSIIIPIEATYNSKAVVTINVGDNALVRKIIQLHIRNSTKVLVDFKTEQSQIRCVL